MHIFESDSQVKLLTPPTPVRVPVSILLWCIPRKSNLSFPLYLSVMGGVSPFRTTLFLHTVSSIPFPLYRGILPCCFPVSLHVPWFSPIRPRLNFTLFSFETFFNDTAEFTLCHGLHDCSLPYRVSLSTRLAPCITTAH